jgi:YfiH family protein
MEVYRFRIFSKFPKLVHGVATAAFGNMSFLYSQANEVIANRHRFFASLKVDPKKVAVAQLFHEADVLEVTEKDWGRGVEETKSVLSADILITNKPDVFLFFVVADCLALFLYDPVTGCVALAHAGWKGVHREVPKIAVSALQERYGAKPEDILVGMSPSLKKESAKYKEINQTNYPQWRPYIYKEGEYYHVDTPKFAYDQLISAGINHQHIEASPIDTRVSPDFFSHRRSAEEGISEARFGCLIGIRK